jgi:adenylate cyclase
VVGYSRLASADEDRTLARLRALRSDLIDPTIAVHKGRVVKRTGDGALIEFRSVVDAVRCAIEVQNGMAERNAGVPPERRIEFRVGIHVGDVVEEADGDLMGDCVNIAARLEGIAKPGGICLSEDAYRQVKSRFDFSATDLGSTVLKNIADPLRVYSIDVGAITQRKSLSSNVTGPIREAHLPISDKPSIAVLAFNTMSGDAEQEYFSDGISEDIITDLSRLPELHVIARNSSFVYKKMTATVPEMAKALGVRYVLEGSVRKAGSRVRVTAQLIDSSSGGHVWADRFDRDLTDIFAVQDELTHEIVAALKLKLTVDDQNRISRGRAVNVEAYELFLRAREQARTCTPLANEAARRLAAAAVAIDEGYVPAHSIAAFTHVLDYANAWSGDPEHSLKAGLELAQLAVSMAEEQPDGHFALGMAFMWGRQLERAQTEAQRALVLSPNSVDCLMLMAHVQIYSGNPAGALQTLDAATQLDPHYPEVLLQFFADAHFSLGNYGQAIAAIEQRLARNPQSETGYALLASCYGHLSRPNESRKAWERALQINPNFSVERRRRVLPFRDPEMFEHRVEGLRKAGLRI